MKAEDLFIQSPIGIGVYNGPAYVIELVNDLMLEYWGRTREQVLHKPLFDALPETRGQGFEEIIAGVFRTGDRYISTEIPVTLNRRTGPETIYTKLIFTPLRNEQGSITGVMGLAHDITDLVLARKGIERTGKKFQQLVEDVPVGITIFRGPKFVVEMANESYLQIIDKQKAEFIGKPLFEALPEVRQNVEPLLNDVYWKGIPFYGTEFEVPLRRHGRNEITYFNFVYQPLREENVVTGIIVVASEVTQQVRQKLLLQQSEERARLATEASMAGVFDVELNTDKVTNSRRLLEIFDLPPSATHPQMIGRVHPQDMPVRDQAQIKAYETGILFYEVRIITETKEIRWVRCQGKAIRNEQGEPIRMIGTVLDITEQKTFSEALENKVKERTIELQRANEELAQRNQELLSFNYISSHDLQEPLRKIQTFASRIQSTEDAISPENQVYLQRMQQSARQMQLLIRDLLEYSRAGQGEKIFEMVSLAGILQPIRQQLLEETSTEHIRIEIGDMPTIEAIPYQINQLFNNLLSNAVKFSRRGKSPFITVHATRENGDHVIRVRDNGIGFLPEHKDQIFEVFRRLHHRSDYPGTGIGLAICKKIVENHHGRIIAEGKPGEGATFTVFLPA